MYTLVTSPERLKNIRQAQLHAPRKTPSIDHVLSSECIEMEDGTFIFRTADLVKYDEWTRSDFFTKAIGRLKYNA